jgi:magnesium chelatase family protein
VEYEKLSDQRLGEYSSKIQKRVEQAHQVQRTRFSLGKAPEAPQPITCNADMRPVEVRQFCQLDETSRSLMHTVMCQMQLSARAYHRVQGEISFREEL